MEKYDLIVIGAGPSGYAAAMRAVDFKKKTLLIEKTHLGGAGVTDGALSSKTWWELSSNYSLMNQSLHRFDMKLPEVSFEELREEVKRAIHERRNLLSGHMDHLQSSHYHDILTFKHGRAKLISEHEIEITRGDDVETVYGEYVILATGSRPRKLDSIPVDEKTVLTSNGIEHMSRFPKSMVIIGAGVVGCEYATIFSGFGKTKVHLIDKGNRILPFEDEDVVQVIEKNLENAGVVIHRNSQLTGLEVKNNKVHYKLEYDDGTVENFKVEKALLSVGRVPNIEGLGLEDLGMEMSSRGIIDNDTQTSISNIYAVGDITADIALVNVAELEGRYCVEKIFGKPKRKLVYDNISTIMFLNPEVAGVGLNEIQAKDKGISYKVASLSYECIPRAIAKRNTQGFIKLLVTNNSDMKILGMRVVGMHASSAIQAVALLIFMDKGIEELSECVHPHPSITEGIQECVRMLLGKSMLKPDALRDNRLKCRICENGVYEDIMF